ncbi:MAG: hypothetical protein M5U26_02545 [Planctomycetota bacterium]|nr:hypothetical protein [Planctomycetota bacterium]
MPKAPPPNVIGAYGPWAAGLLGDKPPELSLRTGRFKNVAAWRRRARAKVLELLAPPEMPRTPRPRVEARGYYEGLYFERLSWQLPWGPRTEAVFLKPESAGPREKLPGVLALHDHGGRKYFGWRKIASVESALHPMLRSHRDECYGGEPWANRVARRGYAVLCHDTFPFASRRVRHADVSKGVKYEGLDPDSREDAGDILRYNKWAAQHEHIMAKSLFCAGTTWPGVYLREDQAALSILAARPDVDGGRLGCGGLSGGGMRTVYLAGLDPRIGSCFCAGFFTTWRDFVLHKSWTHTWMTYAPLAPRYLDFPEILGLRAPAPTMVINTAADPLYTLSEVRRGDRMLREVYKRARAPKNYRFSLHPGGHVLNVKMQDDVFD